MKKHYDFSEGKRGAVLPAAPHKTRITIRLDADIIEWFRQQVNQAGGGNYQSLINDALREHMKGHGVELETLMQSMSRVEGILQRLMPHENPQSNINKRQKAVYVSYCESSSGNKSASNKSHVAHRTSKSDQLANANLAKKHSRTRQREHIPIPRRAITKK